MYEYSADVIEVDEPVSEKRAIRELQSHGVPPDVQVECLQEAFICPDQYSSAKILIWLGY